MREESVPLRGKGAETNREGKEKPLLVRKG
jgi:hypothetical protein